jgi:PAS domain S-box-containing protein
MRTLKGNMNLKMEQSSAKNPNPVLSIAKDGTVLYSNKAGESLLHEWSMEVGGKLSSNIGDLVKRVISRNSPEKIEVKVGKRIYLAEFHPILEDECVNIYGYDISDQKEVEGILRESMNKYRSIVETSVEGIWIFNAVSETTYVNQKMADMLGYDREEMIGSFIWDYADKDDKDFFQIKLANRKQGLDEVYELKLLRKDGSPILFSVSAKGFFDDSGKFEGSVGMFTDITDRKRAEESLQESKARVESIFRSSPIGIGVVVDRMITEANERLCEMTGYSREELLCKSAMMLYPTAEEYEHVGLIKYSMISERGTGYVETRWKRKDGSVVDILLSSSPIISGNLSGEVTFTALDITERKKTEEALKKAHNTLEEKVEERTKELEKAYSSLKESEEKYRNIVETANEGISVLDSEGKFVYVNRKYTEMLGYSEKEIYGKHAENTVEDVNLFRRLFKKRRLGISESYEIELIRKDGSTIWVHINAKSLFDDKGKFKGSLSMLTDITEQKETEEALANFEITRQKEIHHRIKNNLQVISSLLDLQADKFNNRECIRDSEVMEAFRESKDRVASMALIHEELYRDGRLDTIDFSSYIEELANNLLTTNRLGNKDVSLKIDIDRGTYFDMDTAVPLGIIVNELVSNSFKHAFIGRDKGEIQIKLHGEEIGECKIEGNKSTTFILTVSDNGIGIPENLDFDNLDSLGLQLVTTLVNQLDGEIELRRNNGTEFVIRFAVTEESNQTISPASQLIE